MSGAQSWAQHEISGVEIDALARGSTEANLARLLRRAERSRTLLTLRALLDEAGRHESMANPLSSLDEAWDLLERIQKKSPADLDAVLTYPYVSNWAGYTLRRLRERVTDSTPLRDHLGHLHSIAAAASIRAGLDVQLRVPVRDGTVSLPTLGIAHLPRTATTSTAEETQMPVAEVCTASGRTEIRWGEAIVRLPDNPADDAPGWSGLRQLSFTSGRHTLSLLIDDLDLYRALYGPSKPARIDPAEVRAWRQVLAEAWRLICRHCPQQAEAMCSVLDVLVPVPAPGRFQIASASSGEAFGGVAMSRPESPAMLAATLVHESQHILLGGLLHLVPLHDNDPEPRFYAPWRDDPRPVGGLVQGIYAFFGVTRFWRSLHLAQIEGLQRTAAFEFTRWRTATCQALDSLNNDRSLTAVGRRFLNQVETELRPWREERVAADIATAAEQLGIDHEVTWRLQHLQPDPQTVAQVSLAWLARARSGRGPSRDQDTPQSDELVSAPTVSWPHTRADLIRCQITTSDPCADYAEIESKASPADRAFAMGEYADAWHAYRAEIAKSPNSLASWVGFALAWAFLAPTPGAELLLRCPALVRAVYRQLHALGHRPKPDELADWIAAQ